MIADVQGLAEVRIARQEVMQMSRGAEERLRGIPEAVAVFALQRGRGCTIGVQDKSALQFDFAEQQTPARFHHVRSSTAEIGPVDLGGEDEVVLSEPAGIVGG